MVMSSFDILITTEQGNFGSRYVLMHLETLIPKRSDFLNNLTKKKMR